MERRSNVMEQLKMLRSRSSKVIEALISDSSDVINPINVTEINV
jgi:hypothetical protein